MRFPLCTLDVLMLLIINASTGMKSCMGSKNRERPTKTFSCLPQCTGFFEGIIPVEHSDSACNRMTQNDPAERHERKLILNSILGNNAMRIPEERTWFCPDYDSNVEVSSMYDSPNHQIGGPVTWIVRNSSSGPVVLSFLRPDREYEEFSPMNPNIPTPNDNEAILKPGDWTTVRAFQGHIFVAREIKIMDTGKIKSGRVLLRHRPGLVPIRNRSGLSLDCNSYKETKVSGLRETREIRSSTTPHLTPAHVESEKKRTEENLMERCNVMHKGFINRVGCPVDIYWAGGVPPELIDYNTTDSFNQQGDDERHKYEGPNCKELFKFHLGIDYEPNNYLDDWNSAISFEGTYLTHKFIARLSSNPEIVVDEVVIAASEIQDCPIPKKVGKSIEDVNAVVRGVEVTVGAKFSETFSDLDVFLVASRNGTAKLQRKKDEIGIPSRESGGDYFSI